MKILVTGANGQLGYDVTNEALKRGHDVICSDLNSIEGMNNKTSFVALDITDSKAVEKVMFDAYPDAVIHCAAWTNVDGAEEESNLELVKKINVDGTKNIAHACKNCNTKMMYISTDYVFGGDGEAPWKHDSREYSPLNVYAQTKLDGEKCVEEILEKFYIVRIAWAFGTHGNNFVKTMLKLGNSHDEIKVVNDQIGTPTYTFDLARLLVDMAETDKYGYYHATNEGGFISWYDFTCEIFRQANINTKVIPVSTKEYGLSKAKRPHNSRLDKAKLVEQGFKPLPDWKDALNRYLKEVL